MKPNHQSNQFILEVNDYRTAEYNEFCGKTFKIFMFIENFNSDFKNIFEGRK